MFPIWLVAALLMIGTLSVHYFLWEPVLRSRWRVWLASFGLVGADIGAAILFGTRSNQYLIVNDVVLVLLVVGLTNLWAQSGMKARHVAILGAFLTVYDLSATWLLPLTTDMMTRLGTLPFAPMVGWASSISGSWSGIGEGDLLLAAVFPLVMRRAFGRGAGITALLITLAALGAIMVLPIAAIFPAMIVLGPLMVLQYIYRLRRHGEERTTRQYLRAEPVATRSPAALGAAQQLAGSSQKLTASQ